MNDRLPGFDVLCVRAALLLADPTLTDEEISEATGVVPIRVSHLRHLMHGTFPEHSHPKTLSFLWMAARMSGYIAKVEYRIPGTPAPGRAADLVLIDHNDDPMYVIEYKRSIRSHAQATAAADQVTNYAYLLGDRCEDEVWPIEAKVISHDLSDQAYKTLHARGVDCLTVAEFIDWMLPNVAEERAA